MKQSLRIGMLLVIAALAYSNSLRNEFTLDDTLYISSNSQVADATLRGFFSPNTVTNVFRPVTFATLALNWRLGGSHPFGYHLFNLVLNAAVAVLFYLLLLELFSSRETAMSTEKTTPWVEVAFGAALLFAVHPIHTEAVTSIVGRSELLAAGFLFAGWLLYLRNRFIPALLCFGLALLSKESAIIFLPLVALGDYAREHWKPWRWYAIMAAGTAAYLALLWKVQGGRFGQGGIARVDNPLASLPARWRILNALRIGWRYVALLVYPARLSCDYSFHAIQSYMDWRHTVPAALAAAAVVAAWIWAISERRGALIAAGALYAAGFAVTANILTPIGTIMAERLAYLPSAGFCLLAALAWGWLKARQRTVAIALAAAVIAAFTMRTMVRNKDWKDNLTLFESAVKVAPDSVKMRANLAHAYLNSGRLDLAGPELEAALHIDPQYPDALAASGLLQSWLGNYRGAAIMMQRAISLSDRSDLNYDFTVVNLAAVMMQVGQMDKAMVVLNREITEQPRYARAWANRAVIYYGRGEKSQARADAQRALVLDPDNVQAKNLMTHIDSPEQAPAQN